MLAEVQKRRVSEKRTKRARTNLISSANTEDISVLNEKTKKNRGLSNLTYKRVFGED